MKRSIRRLGLAAVAFVVMGALGGSLWFVGQGYSFSAAGSDLVYEDLERFEAVIARLPPDRDQWARWLEEEYLLQGSRGLRAFTATHRVTGERLAGMIGDGREAWMSCRLSDHVSAQEAGIRRALGSFEVLYPRALFPRIFFVVGGERAGGQNGAAGIVVSAELYRGDLANCPTGSEGLRTSSEIPCLVIHELVHFNQAARSPIAYARRWNNLARAIKEGSADFIAELAAGCHINAEAHAWGEAREADLWREFTAVLDSHDTGEWFFVKPDTDRPRDVGYFLGYRIVRAFYERAEDKQDAIRRIMSISDYPAFLARSGYRGDMEEGREGSSAGHPSVDALRAAQQAVAADGASRRR
jgi:hypothetical protein